MTMRRALVNGISVAYEVQGSGPPLLLIMGYRLSSRAWPPEFIDALAKRFTLILFDNRGTGLSEKPAFGYALSNIAKDICGLLEHLAIPRAHVLGYSMGGAVAQELACRYPERVQRLVLCATLCGGPRTVYAGPAVIAVMRGLVGLSPHEAARRIATVTYAPAYLEKSARAGRTADASGNRRSHAASRGGFAISGLRRFRLRRTRSPRFARRRSS